MERLITSVFSTRARAQGSERQLERPKFWPLTSNHQARRIFGACFRCASRFGVDQILAILCRANATVLERDAGMPDFGAPVPSGALPFLPSSDACSYKKDRTYRLLGPLRKKPTVWAECLFVDPIADIAVLGAPDNLDLPNEANEYDDLMKSAIPLPIADSPTNGTAWLITLNGLWFPCSVEHDADGMLCVSNAIKGIVGGMSGSPIVADDGSAIGVLCSSSGDSGEVLTDGGPHPRLMHNLPLGLLWKLLRPSVLEP